MFGVIMRAGEVIWSLVVTFSFERQPFLIYPGCQRFIFSFNKKNRGEIRTTGAKRREEKKNRLRVPQTAEFLFIRIIFFHLFG